MYVQCLLNVLVILVILINTAVDCGVLTITNGQVMTPSGTTFTNNATYSCDPGYNLNGAGTRTCDADGMWTPDPPVCDRKR